MRLRTPRPRAALFLLICLGLLPLSSLIVLADDSETESSFALVWAGTVVRGLAPEEAQAVDERLQAAIAKVPGLEVPDAGRAADGEELASVAGSVPLSTGDADDASGFEAEPSVAGGSAVSGEPLVLPAKTRGAGKLETAAFSEGLPGYSEKK